MPPATLSALLPQSSQADASEGYIAVAGAEDAPSQLPDPSVSSQARRRTNALTSRPANTQRRTLVIEGVTDTESSTQPTPMVVLEDDATGGSTDVDDVHRLTSHASKAVAKLDGSHNDFGSTT